MKLYKALATAMVATAATMAAMPAGNAAVFYDWRNYNEAGGIYDTHGDRYVSHLRDMNDRVSSIRSYGEHYVAFQDEDYQGFSFDIIIATSTASKVSMKVEIGGTETGTIRSLPFAEMTNFPA